MFKKILSNALIAALSLSLVFSCGCSKKNSDTETETTDTDAEIEVYLSGTYYMGFDIENYGSVYFELDADVAPRTVTQIVNLVNSGYYIGTTFNVLADTFIMTSENNDFNTYVDAISGEFSYNDYYNASTFDAGTIALYHTDDDYDDGTSRIMIMTSDNKDFMGYYAAFGKVVAGMNVINSICENSVATEGSIQFGNITSDSQAVISLCYLCDQDLIDYVVENEEESLQPNATITVTPVENFDGYTLYDTLVIKGDTAHSFVLTSDYGFAEYGIYLADYTNEDIYDANSPIVSGTNYTFDNYIGITMPETATISEYILVTKEYNGATGLYMISVKKDGRVTLIKVTH